MLIYFFIITIFILPNIMLARFYGQPELLIASKPVFSHTLLATCSVFTCTAPQAIVSGSWMDERLVFLSTARKPTWTSCHTHNQLMVSCSLCQWQKTHFPRFPPFYFQVYFQSSGKMWCLKCTEMHKSIPRTHDILPLNLNKTSTFAVFLNN